MTSLPPGVTRHSGAYWTAAGERYLSRAEIAAALNLTPGALRTMIHRHQPGTRHPWPGHQHGIRAAGTEWLPLSIVTTWRQECATRALAARRDGMERARAALVGYVRAGRQKATQDRTEGESGG